MITRNSTLEKKRITKSGYASPYLRLTLIEMYLYGLVAQSLCFLDLFASKLSASGIDIGSVL